MRQPIFWIIKLSHCSSQNRLKFHLDAVGVINNLDELQLKEDPFWVYLACNGFLPETLARGADSSIITEFKKELGYIITLVEVPKPGPKDIERINYDWTFQCPDIEAERYISDLREICERNGFEVDE